MIDFANYQMLVRDTSRSARRWRSRRFRSTMKLNRRIAEQLRWKRLSGEGDKTVLLSQKLSAMGKMKLFNKKYFQRIVDDYE